MSNTSTYAVEWHDTQTASVIHVPSSTEFAVINEFENEAMPVADRAHAICDALNLAPVRQLVGVGVLTGAIWN